MIKKLRVALVVHPELIPGQLESSSSCEERRNVPWITEWDVKQALKRLGHEVLIFSVHSKACLKNLVNQKHKYDVVFNLLEQVGENSSEDYLLPKTLEENEIPYTGCDWRDLKIGKDKVKAKKKVSSLGTNIAKSIELRKPKFPLILKFNGEDGSYGIFKKNIIHNHDQLKKRVEYLRCKYEGELFAEEFIKGKEVYVSISRGILGELVVPSVRELCFLESKDPALEIYTEQAKWSFKYQKTKKILTKKLSDELLARKVITESKKIYEGLNFAGPVRIDFRCNDSGVYFLELNPNPNLAFDDDFFLSRGTTIREYDEMIQLLIDFSFSHFTELSSAA